MFASEQASLLIKKRGHSVNLEPTNEAATIASPIRSFDDESRPAGGGRGDVLTGPRDTETVGRQC